MNEHTVIEQLLSNFVPVVNPIGSKAEALEILSSLAHCNAIGFNSIAARQNMADAFRQLRITPPCLYTKPIGVSRITTSSLLPASETQSPVTTNAASQAPKLDPFLSENRYQSHAYLK